MKDKKTQNEQLESILRKAHMPEPSAELKERVIAEASNAWDQSSSEISWQIPLRRLLISAAAAVFVIWLANSSSDYSLARWQSGRLNYTHKQNSNLDALTEILYSPLARNLASTGRKQSMIDASVFHSYTERMLLILNEAQQNRFSKHPAPAEGNSRLFPTQAGLNSYS